MIKWDWDLEIDKARPLGIEQHNYYRDVASESG